MDFMIGVVWATSELRAIAVDERGILRAAVKRPVPPRYPHRGWAEVDARLAAAALIEALAQLVRMGVDPKSVRGIGVGAMGDAALGIDARGIPVAPAMLWLDRRGDAFGDRKPPRSSEGPSRSTDGPTWPHDKPPNSGPQPSRSSEWPSRLYDPPSSSGEKSPKGPAYGLTLSPTHGLYKGIDPETLPHDELTVSEVWEYARSSSDEHVYENTELDGRLNIKRPSILNRKKPNRIGSSERSAQGLYEPSDKRTIDAPHHADGHRATDADFRVPVRPSPSMAPFANPAANASASPARRFEHRSASPIDPSTPRASMDARADFGPESVIDNRMREKMDALQKSAHPPALWLQPAGYLTGFLTGEWTLDITSAHAFPGFSPADLAFAETIGPLPELRASYDIAGGLLPDVAAATGLLPGTPVTCGAHELALGMLGCASAPGHVLEASGQSGSISILCGAPLTAPPMALGCHVVPGQYLLHTGTTAGSVLNWLGDQINDSMTRLIRDAAGLPAGSGGLMFLPHLAGLRAPWDQSVRASFFGLTYDKSPAYLTRAVLEGVAFAIQDILLGAIEHSVPLTRLNICGGSARVDLWSQMKADVTGRPTCIPEIDDAQCLGAAMLAAVAVRRYPSFEAAMANMTRTRKQFMPGTEHRIYRRYFELYQTLSRQLQPAYEQLSRIQGG